jgi:hypothetical protein
MQATGASLSTIRRDIVFINSHSRIFGGSLVWDEHTPKLGYPHGGAS